jgi:hypothetical protein
MSARISSVSGILLAASGVLFADSTVERKTVDGFPVRTGDTVWHVSGPSVRTCRLSKHHLGMWWQWMGKEIYSTEGAALASAIENEKRALDKAKREVRRATRSLKRPIARLPHSLGKERDS